MRGGAHSADELSVAGRLGWLDPFGFFGWIVGAAITLWFRPKSAVTRDRLPSWPGDGPGGSAGTVDRLWVASLLYFVHRQAGLSVRSGRVYCGRSRVGKRKQERASRKSAVSLRACEASPQDNCSYRRGWCGVVWAMRERLISIPAARSRSRTRVPRSRKQWWTARRRSAFSTLAVLAVKVFIRSPRVPCCHEGRRLPVAGNAAGLRRPGSRKGRGLRIRRVFCGRNLS